MKFRNILFVTAGFLVLAGLGGASFYFYSRYQHAQTLLKNPAAAAAEELKQLTDKVAKLTLLPDGESPIVATINDKASVSHQPFFARSEEGDKVLVYNQAARAVLYRPSINRVIEVGPVNTVAGGSEAATDSAQLTAARLAIYNSTSTVGLASVAQEAVNRELSALLTVAKQNSQTAFSKTVVVILTPEAKNLGTQLAKEFAAEMTTEMPKNEIKPEADLLLILGEDYTP